MGKRLLSKDFNKIVTDTFEIPESDFKKYYLNIIDENISDNPDIFKELVNAVKRIYDWYESILPRHQAWEVDDNTGEKRPIKWDEQPFSLMPYGINRFINRSFFDNQITIIEVISVEEKIKTIDKKIKAFEDLTKKSSKRTKDLTFTSLFNNESDGEKVLNIFREHDYLISDVWNYPGSVAKSIVIPFYILDGYFSVFKKNDSRALGTRIRIWCNGLGSYPNNNELKNFLNNPANGKNPTKRFKDARIEFYGLFENAFTKVYPLED